ncbi:MAG: beta-ketoacyl-[acyl-carrier-protein] synthase family protein [Planctomycetota bacterium]|nr:beta-ketoacyl-[acyl-carrier-protein] synthase family protein [Planctomycetota bacterium]
MGFRAVITGIGLRSPLGCDPSVFFRRALSGHSAIRKVRKFDTSAFPVHVGGEIEAHEEHLPPDMDARGLTQPARWCLGAALSAVKDADLDLAAQDPFDTQVVMGVSISSIESLSQACLADAGLGMAHAAPETLVRMNPAAAANEISRALNIQGETVNVTTACSSSTSAIGYAARLIWHGESACVITGGADEGISPLFLGPFGNTGALSKRTEGDGVCRPFDKRRDGAVLSDAACVFVLEEYERAKARGARMYCEITGFGATSDACSSFKLGKSEEPSARAMELALRRAGRLPGEVDYYCALGLSHPFLDVRETRMLKRVFREDAPKVSVSSIKSMMGHPLGAAGAIQAATAALAISNRAIPPTINYEEKDAECDLDYVPNEARERNVRNAMIYTLGTGGSNASLVLSAC